MAQSTEFEQQEAESDLRQAGHPEEFLRSTFQTRVVEDRLYWAEYNIPDSGDALPDYIDVVFHFSGGYEGLQRPTGGRAPAYRLFARWIRDDVRNQERDEDWIRVLERELLADLNTEHTSFRRQREADGKSAVYHEPSGKKLLVDPLKRDETRPFKSLAHFAKWSAWQLLNFARTDSRIVELAAQDAELSFEEREPVTHYSVTFRLKKDGDGYVPDVDDEETPPEEEPEEDEPDKGEEEQPEPEPGPGPKPPPPVPPPPAAAGVDNVFVGLNAVVQESSIGQAFSVPNPVNTNTGPSTQPIPYVSVAMASDLSDGKNLCENSQANGNPLATSKTILPKTTGDEPGLDGGGTASGAKGGPLHFEDEIPTCTFEGVAAVANLNMCSLNHNGSKNPPNTPPAVWLSVGMPYVPQDKLNLLYSYRLAHVVTPIEFGVNDVSNVEILETENKGIEIEGLAEPDQERPFGLNGEEISERLLKGYKLTLKSEWDKGKYCNREIELKPGATATCDDGGAVRVSQDPVSGRWVVDWGFIHTPNTWSLLNDSSELASDLQKQFEDSWKAQHDAYKEDWDADYEGGDPPDAPGDEPPPVDGTFTCLLHYPDGASRAIMYKDWLWFKPEPPPAPLLIREALDMIWFLPDQPGFWMLDNLSVWEWLAIAIPDPDQRAQITRSVYENAQNRRVSTTLSNDEITATNLSKEEKEFMLGESLTTSRALGQRVPPQSEQLFEIIRHSIGLNWPADGNWRRNSEPSIADYLEEPNETKALLDALADFLMLFKDVRLMLHGHIAFPQKADDDPDDMQSPRQRWLHHHLGRLRAQCVLSHLYTRMRDKGVHVSHSPYPMTAEECWDGAPNTPENRETLNISETGERPDWKENARTATYRTDSKTQVAFAYQNWEHYHPLATNEERQNLTLNRRTRLEFEDGYSFASKKKIEEALQKYKDAYDALVALRPNFKVGKEGQKKLEFVIKQFRKFHDRVEVHEATDYPGGG